MKGNQRQETLFQRFCARGGFNLILTIIAVWITFPSIHRWCGGDWFYSILLCLVASLLLAHMVLLPLMLIPFGIYGAFFHRRECPACHERALVVGMRISEPTADPELFREHQPAHCERCQREFRLLRDGTFQEQSMP